MIKKLIFLLFFLLLSPCILGATYYIDDAGNDAGDGSTGSPWLTFNHAFGAMSAADILLVKDGTYDADNGGINTSGGNSGQPPNGSDATHRTVIRAENGLGNVIIQSALILGSTGTKSSYIEIDGIKFIGISSLFNTSYNYVHDCLFYSATGSTAAVLSVGTNDHANGNTYNIIEDVAIDGSERIGGINYNSQYNVWRRVLIRMNGSNYSAGNPSVGFTIYSSQFISAQNIIVIDRVQGDAYPGQDFAGVQAAPAGEFGDNEWLGCMTFDADENGWMIEPTSTETASYTFKLINCVAVNSTSYGIGIQGNGAQSNVLIDHSSVINPGLTGIRMIVSGGCTDPTVQNSYVESSAAGYAVYVDCTNTVSQYNQSFENAYSFTPAGSNNNIQDGQILYPTQPGSGALASNDSSYRGAYVIYKYGVDGTYYGQTGYNTLTANPLWPWPNEDVIKTNFEAISDRGFTAYSGLDGVHNTLTTYIWEYLGNEIPADIYTDETAPTASTASVSNSNGSSSASNTNGSTVFQ